MAQSFGFVEEKLYEAEFFLDKFRSSTRLSFDARCYFSAFVSAARSVTLALQASMNGISGFDIWYGKARENLRADPLAPFFIEIRNDVVHTGRNPLDQVGIAHLQEALSGQMRAKQSHFLVFPDVGAKGRTVLADAVEASTLYFKSLVSVIFDCYESFTCMVDPQWYFTRQNFEAMGKTVDDALEEMGFPRGWLAVPGEATDERAWQALRSQQPPNQVNDLFLRHIGRRIAGPDEKS